MAALAPYFFGIVLTLLAIFLILLVLVQRGRGGGLTGALGGVGGSSAFGAKAGDVFTRITVVATTIWICVCVAAAYWSGHRGDVLGESEALIPPPAESPIVSDPVESQATSEQPGGEPVAENGASQEDTAAEPAGSSDSGEAEPSGNE